MVIGWIEFAAAGIVLLLASFSCVKHGLKGMTAVETLRQRSSVCAMLLATYIGAILWLHGWSSWILPAVVAGSALVLGTGWATGFTSYRKDWRRIEEETEAILRTA
jgi:hypothetical protein